MSKTTTAPGLGQQTVALVRTLAINAMLVLVPVAAYYFAVIEREDRFRTEQAFDALREIREGMSSYVDRVDALLATSAQILLPDGERTSGAGHPRLGTLGRDLHLDAARIVDGGNCGSAADSLQPLDLWFANDRAADSALRLSRCLTLNGKLARVELQAPPGVLLDSPRALRRFAQVLLVGNDGQVLAALAPQERHQSTSVQEPVRTLLSPASFAGLLKALPDPVADDSKAPASGTTDPGLARIVSGDIAGQRYRAYIAPLRPPFPIYDRDPRAGPVQAAAVKDDGKQPAGAVRLASVYLVGLDPESRLDDAAQALGLAGSWYLLAAVLVCATAWPLLRVLLMAPNQALSRRLLAATMIGCLILCGMVTLLVESVIEQQHLLRVRDSEADLYALRLAEAARGEARRILTELVPYRDAYAGGTKTASTGNRAIPTLLACEGSTLAQRKPGGERACDLALGTDRYCQIRLPREADGRARGSSIAQVIATGADGVVREAPMLSPFGCLPRAAEIPVDRRPYFLKLHDDHGWPVAALLASEKSSSGQQALPPVPEAVSADWPKQFVAQRLFAKTDASRGLELAIPRNPLAGGGFVGIVGALSPVYALSAALRPPFLSFAIVEDASGVVVFHSDDEASLRENFFVETGREPMLMAAVADRQPARFSGYYRGESEHFVTRPIPGLPWTVVVFHAVDITVAPAVDAAFVALLQLAALLTLVGLALAAMLVVMRLVRLGPAAWARTPWQWIWPQWRLRDRYPWLALSLAALIAINVVAIQLLGPRAFDVGWGLLASLLVIAAWLAFQWFFAPASLPEPGSGRPRLGLRERWKEPRSPTLPAPFRNPVDTIAEFRFWYVSCLVLGLMLVAAVPASALYFGAVDTLREGELRVAMRDTANSFVERTERIARDLSRQAGGVNAAAGDGRDPVTIALAEPAVGFACDHPGRCIWAPDAESGARDPESPGLDSDHAALAPATPPWRQFTIDRLAPLLPRLETISRALETSSYGIRGDGARLSYSGDIAGARPDIEAPLRAVLQKGRGASSKWFERLVAGALGLAGLGLIIYVGTLLSRRTLGVDAPPAPRAPVLAGVDFKALRAEPPRAARQPFGEPQPPWRWWYIGSPAGASVPDFAWLRQQLESMDEHRIISLADVLLNPGSLSHGAPLLLLHFDRAVLDPARRRSVLEALERRARMPVHTLLCAMSPPWTRLCEPASFPDPEGLPDAEEALRWIDLRRRYAVHHWHEATPAVAVPDWLISKAKPNSSTSTEDEPPAGLRDSALSERLIDEVIALGELLGRTPRSLPAIEALARLGKLRDVGDLIELLIDEVQGDFHRAWQFCTTAERLALYQLANNRIPNPRNRRVLDDLLIRRLVILAPEARIACDSFRRFVLNAEPAERFAEWTGLERGGPWDSVRAPFLILLTLLLAWFAFAAGDVFNTVAAVLAGTVGLLANASKVLGFARGAGGDK